jgi:hypothetical protein
MRRWVIVGAVVWAVVLVGAAAWSFHRGEPTAREQRTIAQASPVVDRATGEVVAAVFDANAVVEISGRRLRAGCRLTPTWAGAELDRSVTIRTTEAEAPALLDRIAGRLPAGYGAAVRHNDLGGVHRLRADAGGFVAINGALTSPGVVSVSVRTGCRPPSPEVDPEAGEEIDGPWGKRMIAKGNLVVLRAEGVEVTDVAVVPCPGGGGVFVSQAATGRGVLPPRAFDRLRQVGAVVIDEPDHVAFRGPVLSGEVRAVDGLLTSTGTEARCPP